ncbi:hypothetical protein R3P38DRAFT_3048605 [Favolaschia claudopus]|uniref:F-box domain-containing protein n=1 Tax=Favolaschia claudopus TaxID=2862362 RepID=A0AAW0A6Q3_9AGAR
MYSPFQSKLGTNYRARDDEVPQIRSLLVQPLSRMQEIDTEIAELYKAIDALRSEKATLRSYIRNHRALIAPIQRIPPEILSEIFVACLPKERNCVMSATESPMLLGRVCSLWRTLSHSIPRLWCRLHIVEPELSSASTQVVRKEKYAQWAEAAKDWLERSGQSPLSISLTGDDDDRHATDVTAILQVLIPFAYRWQNISVRASLAALECLSSISEQDVPMLTRLHIQRAPSSPDSAQWPALQFLSGPRIAHFSLSGRHGNIPSLPVRWSQLRSLSIRSNGRSVTNEAAMQVLSLCPRLEACELTISNRIPRPLTGTILELPHLRSLTLDSQGPHSLYAVDGLFSRLSLPGLLHLVVLGLGLKTNGAAPLLATSPCLQSLEMNPDVFNKQTFIGILNALPLTVQRIKFFGGQGLREAEFTMDDDILAKLTPSTCPSLQELHINDSNSISDQALLEFIVAMMSVSSPTLRLVDVYFVRPKQVDIHRQIQLLLDAGLRVELDYESDDYELPGASPWKNLPDEDKAETAQLTSNIPYSISTLSESSDLPAGFVELAKRSKRLLRKFGKA